MKLGFTLRRILTESTTLIRKSLGEFIYILWLLFDPSKFKRIENQKIRSLLVVYSGSVGDSYNIIGIMNRVLKKYNYLNVYYLTVKRNESFVKNPGIKVIDSEEAKKLMDSKKIDAAIILDGLFNPELFDWEFYIKVLKVPYRIGLSFSSISTFFKLIPFSYTRRIYPTYQSSCGDYISAFEALGFRFNKEIEFYYISDAEKYAEGFIKKNKINKKEKIIFMHIGSKKAAQYSQEKSLSGKAWPYERWIELAEILIKRYNARLIFTGTAEEGNLIKEVISRINNNQKVINTAGELSLEQIASLIKRADLIISLDTGVAHIGAQTGTPLIVLLGGEPSSCHPWTNNKIMLFHPEFCNNCRRYDCPEGNNICMKAITVEEVLEATKKMLK